LSENMNVCWRRRAIVSLGDSDLSNRPIAAINATEMVRNVREKTGSCARRHSGGWYKAIVSLRPECTTVETSVPPDSVVGISYERVTRIAPVR